jgi:hypothetical protein
LLGEKHNYRSNGNSCPAVANWIVSPRGSLAPVNDLTRCPNWSVTKSVNSVAKEEVRGAPDLRWDEETHLPREQRLFESSPGSQYPSIQYVMNVLKKFFAQRGDDEPRIMINLD